tara:strand:- start:71 stop:256 length:186 start_codon:yes stop_codon:yes gene_type:complete
MILPAHRGFPPCARSKLTGLGAAYNLDSMRPSKKNIFDSFVFIGLLVNVIVIVLILYFFVF